MESDPPQSTLGSWLDSFNAGPEAVAAARARAVEVGVASVDATTGAVLRLLCAATAAKAVVELGTGAGVASLWLLAGMRSDGVLTSVDPETEHQRLAKLSLAEAGHTSGRARLIAGRALDVLPRLSDGAYDLVFCDALKGENPDYLEAAVRLLRPGGLLVFAGALGGGRVADSTARDVDTVALRELAKQVGDDDRFTAVMVPVGSGLLAAALTG